MYEAVLSKVASAVKDDAVLCLRHREEGPGDAIVGELLTTLGRRHASEELGRCLTASVRHRENMQMCPSVCSREHCPCGVASAFPNRENVTGVVYKSPLLAPEDRPVAALRLPDGGSHGKECTRQEDDRSE